MADSAAANSACDDTADIVLYTVKEADGNSKSIPYQPDCPCWDASGKGLNGAGQWLAGVGHKIAT